MIALQFLTRIPTPHVDSILDREIGQSLLVYPAIGLIIGLALMAIATVFSGIPPILQSVLVLLAWLFITGLLHIDGLADSADGWLGGYGDRDRTLEIMKDPAAGPAGVIAILAVVLTKFIALIVVLDHQLLWPLLWVPILGRMAAQALVVSTPYARPSGMGQAFARYAPRNRVLFSVSLLLVLNTIFVGVATTLCFILTCCLLRQLMMVRLNGYTGDTLGASIEIIEATTIFILAANI